MTASLTLQLLSYQADSSSITAPPRQVMDTDERMYGIAVNLTANHHAQPPALANRVNANPPCCSLGKILCIMLAIILMPIVLGTILLIAV